MTSDNLKLFIRDIPDFPKPGILFKDITPLLGDPASFESVIHGCADQAKAFGAQAIVGIESRGFIFGAPVAAMLKLPFVPVRKPGKLPAKRMSIEYSLEYGSSQLDIHEDALTPGQRAVVIDDLLATGGTARAAAKLIELVGGVVAGFVFVIELETLNGRQALEPYPVKSILSYE